jgi:hypothetical protein
MLHAIKNKRDEKKYIKFLLRFAPNTHSPYQRTLSTISIQFSSSRWLFSACFRIHCGAIFYVRRSFYVFMFAIFSNLQMLIKWFSLFSVHWHKITVSFCGFRGFVVWDEALISHMMQFSLHTAVNCENTAKKRGGCVDLIMFSDCRHMLKLCRFNFRVAMKMIAWKHDIKIESIYINAISVVVTLCVVFRIFFYQENHETENSFP